MNRIEAEDLDLSKKNTPGSSSSSSTSLFNKKKLKEEIDMLNKKGYLSDKDLGDLVNKYGEELTAQQVIKIYNKRVARATKVAEQVAEKAYEKYGRNKASYEDIARKMLKYKKEKNWSDLEYYVFLNRLKFLMTGTVDDKGETIHYSGYASSKMNKLFGNNRMMVPRGLKIADSEQKYVADILKTRDVSRNTHKASVYQAATYADCSLLVLNGSFDSNKNSVGNHISPLMIALFFPKFEILNLIFLMSSFGDIIKDASENREPSFEPNRLLLENLLVVENDIICASSNGSAIADIKKRYEVQLALQSLVLRLRTGNFYDTHAQNLLFSVLSDCKDVLFNDPHFTFNQDEGNILTKLFSIFAFRPTFVSTKPLTTFSNYATNNYIPNYNPGIHNNNYMNNYNPVYTVTAIDRMTIILPDYEDPENMLSIDQALNQVIWITDEATGNIVPNEKEIIDTNELLVISVNRRKPRVQIKSFISPLNYNQLPYNLTNYERINNYPLDVPFTLSINAVSKELELRSVVIVESLDFGIQGASEIFIGTRAIIRKPSNVREGFVSDTCFIYDPLAPSNYVYDSFKNDEKDGPRYAVRVNEPISIIPTSLDITNEASPSKSFLTLASTEGIIYIYAKPEGYIRPGRPIIL
jgi:hypothetical protein